MARGGVVVVVTLLLLLDRRHGPRIKVAMPGTPYVDGVPYVTGWLSLLSERGEYNLIPVVEDVAPDGVRPVQPSEVPPSVAPSPRASIRLRGLQVARATCEPIKASGSHPPTQP
jgi:hypothetical protein